MGHLTENNLPQLKGGPGVVLGAPGPDRDRGPCATCRRLYLGHVDSLVVLEHLPRHSGATEHPSAWRARRAFFTLTNIQHINFKLIKYPLE